MPQRRRGDAEHVGDVVDAELLVVAQHEAVALAVREVAQGVDDLALVVAQHELVNVRDAFLGARQTVAKGDEAPAVVVPRQVEHDRAEVGGGLGLVLDPVRGSGQADERLLHQVLGRVAIVDEQPGQAHQRPALALEELDEEPVDVDDRRHRSRREGDVAEERGDLHHPAERARCHWLDRRTERRPRVTRLAQDPGDELADRGPRHQRSIRRRSRRGSGAGGDRPGLGPGCVGAGPSPDWRRPRPRPRYRRGDHGPGGDQAPSGNLRRH